MTTTALITGASSGIGAVYADRLAARGYNLLLVARREDRLNSLAADLQKRYGIEARTMVADLSQPEGIQRVETVLQEDASIAVLVNNAGAAALSPFLSSTAQQHEAINTLNTTALMRLTLAVLPRFVENNRGTLINIASVVAFHARAGSAVYSATKAWVLNFTRGLQEEFADSNIRIQAVLPAATATEIWGHSGITLDALPEGSVMTTEDLVDAALAGLDLGEPVTIPPVENVQLWEEWEAARLALFSAARNGKPASRYTHR
ncbi:Short-chain dehydrogenase/reductase SDR [Enterobacter sp. FY-07]|uniref:SDR family NAD(P)-dependent oxidoreductase n=1 Tax=Kosakonia oryzendophytica TaxID=1005665 RepID=UPI000777FABC|nr:SDR family oxidoreductase [Kosakonia oryzendophytica]AMO48920.1 Short-chain dehydrogenase/reductase SDR [Enterobacter sp. FY-07]WBT56582.1 SDR family oxidoreductase [Kosakonia oryzendophytica]